MNFEEWKRDLDARAEVYQREAKQEARLRYKGIVFQSHLHKQWATFFDLVGWEWEYQPDPIEIGDGKTPTQWRPTFRVEFPCTHSECCGAPGPMVDSINHELLVEVADVNSLAQFPDDGLARRAYQHYLYGSSNDGVSLGADSVAFFGNHPKVSEWQMSHGSGGGIFTVGEWVVGPRVDSYKELDALWKQAGEVAPALVAA